MPIQLQIQLRVMFNEDVQRRPFEGTSRDEEKFESSRQNSEESLIYELMRKKEKREERDQRVEQVKPQEDRFSPNEQMHNDESQYGELLEVNQLFVKDEVFNRQIIKNFHEHLEDDNKIKVFINPNPPLKKQAVPQRSPTKTNEVLNIQKLPQRQVPQSKKAQDIEPIAQRQVQESEAIDESQRDEPIREKPIKEKRSLSKDLRIRELVKIKNLPKEDAPKTTRKPTVASRQSDPSSHRNRSVNKSSSDEMDSYEQFKQYKRKKKENGVKTLIKKVESLQKKVKQLKTEKQQLQKMKIIQKILPPSKQKQYGIASNLISIKVETDNNLLIKQDILMQLKKIKQKVDHLDSKANSNEKSKPIDHYQSLSPYNMVESKLQQTSNLMYSQARERNGRMTGKIFKKSEIKSNHLEDNLHQEQKESKQLTNQHILPRQIYEKQQKIGNLSDITQPKARTAISITKQMQKNRKNLEPELKKAETELAYEHRPSLEEDLSKQSFVPSSIHRTSSELPKNNELEQRQEKIQENRQKRRQLQHKQHSPPEKTQAQEARGFVRSGLKINNFNAEKQKLRVEEEKSLKMLEFDTGKEKFLVDSNNTDEDVRLSKNKSKQPMSFEEAADLIPTVPSITNFPTYDTSQEILVEMGKELFNVFKVSKINDDQTVLKVKKYKNCTYFGIDSENNILLHYEGRVYFGGWRQFMNGEGEKYGEGIEYQANKFVYRGQFREGKRNGTGVLKIYNSAQKVSIYIGQFIDGIKHGEGKQFDENGVKYEGEWKDGKKDGFGRLYLGHNESYEGTFEKGLKSSHGTQLFKNGDKYQGEYLVGKFHGKGKYYWGNGSVYSGQFKNGMRNGKGFWKSNHNNGDTYEGEYENDMKHGFGIYCWANGSSYQGNFYGDLKHGKGTLIHENGKVSHLQWQNGNVIAKSSNIEQQSVLSNTNIRNYSKSLPINKKVFAPKQKVMDNRNSNPIINNEMLKTLKSSSASNLPKGIPHNRQFHFEDNNQQPRPEAFMKLYDMTDRPMTSKSVSSISANQFKLQRRSLGKEGLPRDPPYKGIRPTNNIINF